MDCLTALPTQHSLFWRSSVPRKEHGPKSCCELESVTLSVAIVWPIVILMWGGNNVTRPFQLAGAAALGPVIGKRLKENARSFEASESGLSVHELCRSLWKPLLLSRRNSYPV